MNRSPPRNFRDTIEPTAPSPNGVSPQATFVPGRRLWDFVNQPHVQSSAQYTRVLSMPTMSSFIRWRVLNCRRRQYHLRVRKPHTSRATGTLTLTATIADRRNTAPRGQPRSCPLMHESLIRYTCDRIPATCACRTSVQSAFRNPTRRVLDHHRAAPVPQRPHTLQNARETLTPRMPSRTQSHPIPQHRPQSTRKASAWSLRCEFPLRLKNVQSPMSNGQLLPRSPLSRLEK